MKKKEKIIFSLGYLLLSYAAFFLAVYKISFINFSYDLLFFFSISSIYILLHLFFDIKKMYDFIYRKRYLIGIIVFIFLVVGKYNGSSVGLYNNIIQPEYNIEESRTIIGINRPIRSDEWLVATPTALSQTTEEVNFSSINNLMNAKENLVTLYPNLPSKDISILLTPNNWGYLFLNTERAFSFSWYFVFFLLLFSSFEMLMILTKKNKLYSLMGSLLITLSPVVQWWQNPNIMAYGSLAIVVFYYFIKETKTVKKILLSIFFGYVGALYIMYLYPAWQIPYGYCYLIIIIWMIVQNKKLIKWKDLIYLFPVILTITSIIIPIFLENKDIIEIISNTAYPGARMSTGGGEWRLLSTYFANMFYPYIRIDNPCEFSQYISLFPLPTIYGIYLMIKNKKKDLFLILSSIVIISLFIWCAFPLPKIISKLTLIYMSTEVRAQVAIGYLSVIVMTYILSHYEKNKKIENKNLIIPLLIAISFVIIGIKLSNAVIDEYFPGCLNIYTTMISLLVFIPLCTLFIVNKKKTNLIFVIMMIIVSIIGGLLVSPINKGLDVLYKKPLAKEVRKLVNEDEGSVFMVVNSGILFSNYIMTNGAKTINSTNYLPNLELYYLLDEDKDQVGIYNRYEHVAINLVEGETEFILNHVDSITINLNYDDVCKTGVDYLVVNGSSLDNYEEVYSEYGIKIYKSSCIN